jgi:hypothetical protein
MTIEDIHHAAVMLGHLGGLKGGHARRRMLPPERRRELAVHAATVRWERYRNEQAKAAQPAEAERSNPERARDPGGPRGGGRSRALRDGGRPQAAEDQA